MDEPIVVDRVEAEWTAINAFREIIRIGARGDSSKATYFHALNLGGELYPELLGDDVSLLKRGQESDLAREYRQRAQAKRLQTGKEICPLDLIREEIQDVRGMLTIAERKEKTDRLKRRLTLLDRAEIELDPQKHSENELIFRDAYNVERNVPEIGQGKGYRDFELPDDNVLRLRVFHPDKPEHISGADIIYERHSANSDKVFLAAVQYKIWRDKVLPISDTRMQSQIERLKKHFCRAGLCEGDNSKEYRFPFCAAFLRPTDQLQAQDQRFHSTGEHIPVCKIDECTTEGARGGKLLEYDNIRSVSLAYDVFEDLFNRGKIGSRGLSYAQVAEKYQEFEALTQRDRLLIHAQDFSPLKPQAV